MNGSGLGNGIRYESVERGMSALKMSGCGENCMLEAKGGDWA